jgi:hypothetical protein
MMMKRGSWPENGRRCLRHHRPCFGGNQSMTINATAGLDISGTDPRIAQQETSIRRAQSQRPSSRFVPDNSAAQGVKYDTAG